MVFKWYYHSKSRKSTNNNNRKKIEEQYQSPAFPGILGEVNALQEWIVVAEQKPKVVDYKKPIDRRYLLSFCTDLFFKWPLWENVMFSCSLW